MKPLVHLFFLKSKVNVLIAKLLIIRGCYCYTKAKMILKADLNAVRYYIFPVYRLVLFKTSLV